MASSLSLKKLSLTARSVAGCLTGAISIIVATSALPASAIPLDSGLISFDIDCDCSNTSLQGTVGWAFTVNTQKTIGYLGVYDQGGDGLNVATDVGLWDATTQTLLASVTVPSGTAGILQGQFRYASIPGVTLNTGTTYVLGAQYNQPFQSDWFQLLTVNNSLASWISYIDGAAVNPASSLTIPNLLGGLPGSLYGPNLAAINDVPVPGPLPILGAGAAYSWSRRLRRRVVSAKRPLA